jgi:hypothetical protein
MAKNLIGDPPFPPVVLFDHDRLFNEADLRALSLRQPDGITLCIRSPTGHAKRGGYFFHFKPMPNGDFMLYEFDSTERRAFTSADLILFINHCTGREFHEPSLLLCQTELNFRKDAEPDA